MKFDGLPSTVELYEVGPRDGLQNEVRTLSTEEKVRLIRSLAASGLRRIEVTSFVAPRWIPQLADADRIMMALAEVKPPGVSWSALVPNMKGLERALATDISEVAVFLSTTETHSRKNLNKSVAEAIATAAEVARGARSAGKRVRCYLSTVWGCPYEGQVTVAQVVDVVSAVAQRVDFDELSLGDTIGVGTPKHVAAVVEAVTPLVPAARLALHMHDTRGMALANVMVGLDYGIRVFDSSVGGLGGCPYAPGAAGNVATEDLLYLLNGLGVGSSVDFAAALESGALAQELLGRRLPGKTLQAALGERERQRARNQTGA